MDKSYEGKVKRHHSKGKCHQYHFIVMHFSFSQTLEGASVILFSFMNHENFHMIQIPFGIEYLTKIIAGFVHHISYV